MFLEIQNVSKSFSGKQILKGIQLSIMEGELFTFLGPSGSGKTTLLNCILGIHYPEEGEIILEGNSIVKKPSNERNIGMVFQNYSLFPNMTVYQNIEFPLLASQNKSLTDIIFSKIIPSKQKSNEAIVLEALELVKMEKHANKFPNQLSGGEQQRVALARALVFNPNLLCLDEPLGAIDKNMRYQLQLEIRDLQKRLSKTMLYVTHDQSEAFLLSDRIAIMHEGNILQVGTPEDLYYHPQNEFIALFLGDCNIFRIKEILSEDNQFRIKTEGQTTLLIDKHPGSPKELLGIRPESFTLHNDRNPDLNVLEGKIISRTFINGSYKYIIKLNQEEKITFTTNVDLKYAPQIGENVKLKYNSKSFIYL